ncbi:P-loop containing nucleoside triphosphate hydrolase protein [Camillea tinctor]|nr:P-loop containing nucleoside triphosphate hydrolase protein [Camillea tinctor]
MPRHIDALPKPVVVKDKKVIVLSFGRNGTMGLMHALEILGYKPYHMKTVLEHGAPHLNVLNDAVQAKYHGSGKLYGKEEFDKWFADYDAILDVSSFFVQELVEAYPDAKFILTYRNSQKWVVSINNTMLKMVTLVRARPFAILAYMNSFMAAWVRFGWLAPRHIWKDKPLGTDAAAIQTYHDHNALVKKLVPPERLLVVKLEDGLGWEEICPFLGHEAPETRYPRGNDPKEFGKLLRGYVAKGVIPLLGIAVSAAALVALPVLSGAGMKLGNLLK